jgi:hypothetical protein
MTGSEIAFFYVQIQSLTSVNLIMYGMITTCGILSTWNLYEVEQVCLPVLAIQLDPSARCMGFSKHSGNALAQFGSAML